jgi:ketosteroid isomerase-like protein
MGNQSDASRAIEDIHQLKARFCRFLDLKLWGAFEELFAVDANIKIVDGEEAPDHLRHFDDRRQFLAAIRDRMGPLITVHQVFAPEISVISHSTAKGVWAVADRLIFADGKALQGYGHYHETYSREGGSWVIQSMRLSRLVVETIPPPARGTRVVVEELLKRLGTGDAEQVSELFTEQVDWQMPGDARLPWTGSRSRKTEVTEYFNALWLVFEPGKSKTTVAFIVVDGTEAVVLGKLAHTVKSNGCRFETPVAMHLTVTNGKISRLHLYEDTLTVFRAFEAPVCVADGCPAISDL